MSNNPTFIESLEAKVSVQLRLQRVAYLLGAGSSYLNGNGYPLSYELWEQIKPNITDSAECDAIQAKLDGGADGIEHALDLLDDGGATDTPYRHTVTKAVAKLFMLKNVPLDTHIQFLRRLVQKGVSGIRIFSLNYDPLIEASASKSRIRLVDGFHGAEDMFFQSSVFDERIFTIRGTHRGRTLDEAVKPIQLLKLHGSLGWYECPKNGVRRCAYVSHPPVNAKRLMIPPQKRKAADTIIIVQMERQ